MRALCDLCTEKESRLLISHYAKIHAAKFCALLEDSDPKIRKNMALLLGRLDATQYAPLLLRALAREQMDFVKPSIILALGNAEDVPEVLAALQKLQIPLGEDKNLREQRSAREKALSKLAPKREIARPVPMKKPVRVLLAAQIPAFRARNFPALATPALFLASWMAFSHLAISPAFPASMLPAHSMRPAYILRVFLPFPPPLAL